MAENTQVANFNTQLSYYTNRYVDLMERDLTSRGMEFDSYSKDCVVAAICHVTVHVTSRNRIR